MQIIIINIYHGHILTLVDQGEDSGFLSGKW